MEYQQFQDENVVELLKKKKKLVNDNFSYQDHIQKNRIEIKMLEKKIYKCCSHEWIRDWDVAFDDRCKYKCKKCNLWRNDYMYN